MKYNVRQKLIISSNCYALFALFFLAVVFFILINIPCGFCQIEASSTVVPVKQDLNSKDGEIKKVTQISDISKKKNAYEPSENSGTSETKILPGKKSNPTCVDLGFYIIDISDFNLRDNTFALDFYFWQNIHPGSTKPWSPKTIEFMNVREINPVGEEIYETMENGIVHHIQRLRGTFKGQFELRLYPFDKQTLTLVIEDQENTHSDVIFYSDAANENNCMSWIDKKINIPDWKIVNSRTYVDKHTYPTDFGMHNGSALDYSNFSRFNFEIDLRRMFIPHLIRLLIPLLIVLFMSYLVFFISAQEFEAECGICVTTLLTAVALHISQSSVLPEVGYLVVSDKVFILIYALILFTMVQSVVVNNYVKKSSILIVEQLDRSTQWIFPFLLIGGIIIIDITSGIYGLTLYSLIFPAVCILFIILYFFRPPSLDKLRHAAKHGDLYAQYLLGKILIDRATDAAEIMEGRAWLNQSAGKNNSNALELLGDILSEGIKCQKDNLKAYSYYFMSAEYTHKGKDYERRKAKRDNVAKLISPEEIESIRLNIIENEEIFKNKKN